MRKGERMLKTGGLALKVKKKIYDYIFEHPGLHLNELSRRLKIPISTLYYHLNNLKDEKILTTKTEGRYLRYYINKELGSKNISIISILRKDTPLKIIIFLLGNPGSSQVNISKSIKKHKTTVAFHLEKLIKNEMVECISNGNSTNYSIINKDQIVGILGRYKYTLISENLEQVSYYSLKFDESEEKKE